MATSSGTALSDQRQYQNYWTSSRRRDAIITPDHKYHSCRIDEYDDDVVRGAILLHQISCARDEPLRQPCLR